MSDLAQRLRTKADMIMLGERIAFGSDAELMREAADALDVHAGVKRKSGCTTEFSSNYGEHWNAVSQHIDDRLKKAALANQIREDMKIFIKQNQTPRGGYTRAFVESIGVEWPLTHGWKERWIQKQVEAKLNA